MDRARWSRGQEGQGDVRRGAGRQFNLSDFGRFLQTRRSDAITACVNAGSFSEAFRKVLENELIHVCAAKLGIAARRLHFKYALAEFHNCDVKRPAAEVDDTDPQLLAEAIESVSKRSGRWLVDQSRNVKSGDAQGVLRRVPLVVGTVTTARVTGAPRDASASRLIFCRRNPERSSGETRGRADALFRDGPSIS